MTDTQANPEPIEPTTLTDRANDLRERKAKIATMPVLSRMDQSQQLADDLIELVADIAAVVDHNTPFIDENTGD